MAPMPSQWLQRVSRPQSCGPTHTADRIGRRRHPVPQCGLGTLPRRSAKYGLGSRAPHCPTHTGSADGGIRLLPNLKCPDATTVWVGQQPGTVASVWWHPVAAQLTLSCNRMPPTVWVGLPNPHMRTLLSHPHCGPHPQEPPYVPTDERTADSTVRNPS